MSLIRTHESKIPGLSSSKEFRTIAERLRLISNDMSNNKENENVQHNEFLRTFSKNVIHLKSLIDRQ